jgi:hypothetical protein
MTAKENSLLVSATLSSDTSLSGGVDLDGPPQPSTVEYFVDIVVIRKHKTGQIWGSRGPKDSRAGFARFGSYMLST